MVRPFANISVFALKAKLGSQVIRGITALVAGSALIACSNGSDGASSVLDVAAQFRTSSLHDYYQEIATFPDFTDIVHKWSESRFSDQAKVFLNRTSNARFAIDGIVFSDTRKLIASSKSALEVRDKKFSSVNAYWKSIGFNPGAKVSLAQFQAGLGVMARSRVTGKGLTKAELRTVEAARMVAFSLATVAAATENLGSQAASLALDVVVYGSKNGPNDGPHKYDPAIDRVCVSTELNNVEKDGYQTWWGGREWGNGGKKSDSLVYEVQEFAGSNYGLNKSRASWLHLSNKAKEDKQFFDCARDLVADWPSPLNDKNADSDLADKLMQAGPRVLTPGESVSQNCSSIQDDGVSRTGSESNEACWANMQVGSKNK